MHRVCRESVGRGGSVGGVGVVMDEDLKTVLRKYDTAFCSVHLDNVSLTIINCKDEDIAKSTINILTLALERIQDPWKRLSLLADVAVTARQIAIKTTEKMSKDR